MTLSTLGQSERVVDAIRAAAADTEEDMAEAAADEAVTRSALELLGSKRNDAYEAALTASREDPQAWWADTLASDPDEMGEGEEAATADVEGLRRFLEDDPRQMTAPSLTVALDRVVGTAKPVNKLDKRSAARLDVKQRWFQPKRC